ncbi:suppressor of fused protein SUFU [Herbihabitans rhizosphaerae]|uniref:Suppressor of fused protein SUFU n=1 Tax=Herbihabitans rhizosphaerae TaxID=1872711 RepID=A0A4Q7KMF1_9PSEU|nr:suppressor of fused domain protein [Herbihabitans rhizosphaerae]RZS37447.1 suppressor of fused protein SUFU [Herbihabitans rhizosphaerae]
MADASESDQAVFLTATAAFDCEEQPDVFEHTDEAGEPVADVIVATDRPQDGATSYSTVGLSNHPLSEMEDEYPTRVEIVGACASDVEYYGDVLATVALNIRDSTWFPQPGGILPDAIGVHDSDVATKHVLLTPPFIWDDGPHTMYLHDKTVVFLFALPISDAEREYADKNGVEALGELLDEHEVDVFDLNRPSVA